MSNIRTNIAYYNNIECCNQYSVFNIWSTCTKEEVGRRQVRHLSSASRGTRRGGGGGVFVLAVPAFVVAIAVAVVVFVVDAVAILVR